MIRQRGTVHRQRGNAHVVRRLSTFGAALVTICTTLLAIAQPASASVNCHTVAILHPDSAKYVTAEIRETGIFNGMLRARADNPGAWEMFTRCIDPETRVFTLRSLANNKYVTTEVYFDGAYQYLLRARADSVGPWERFILYPQNTFLDAFTGYPGYYVTAEVGAPGSDQGMLRSNRRSVGPWEYWWFEIQQ